MSLEVPSSSLARCAVHPEMPAAGTCSRCGGFVCTDCLKVMPGLAGRVFCSACAARPEVNYLEAFRLEFWGRRDRWAWTVGLVSLGLLALGLVSALDQRAPTALRLLFTFLTPVPVGVAFFLGRSWARHALVATPVATPVVMAVLLEPSSREEVALMMVCAVPALIIAVVIHSDVRNQLFFRRPVTPGQLKALWNVRRNNPLARHALSFGLSGVLLPVFAPLAVLCGAVALRRVDPEAHPPIGRGGQALAGLILGIASLLLWGFVLLSFLYRFLSGVVIHK
ncbi:DUF4190 domain-containing protein [Corallococcus llansteffanensis]|uniref:DUF4190 domain-containing protein n=1 Tax=Corallococcus llansteffanensis TaxID=2316731 RepID=A0A3A8NYE1_9BACT|nr:DUF4190 domain-containing protein [Corallococcus llansteffanensis]RKH49083.1 DUF4190 domain-containing protein [Corallococcus llansteffanensis]